MDFNSIKYFHLRAIGIIASRDWIFLSIKVKNDHRSKFSNLSNWKEEAWKNQGFNGIRTRDLRDTGAMLYQLSYEATHWERGQFIEFISPVRSEMMWNIWKIYCDDDSSLWSTTAVQIYELFHIYFASFLSIFKIARVAKKIWRIIRNNLHNSLHLGRKYAQIFVVGYYLFLKAQSSLLGTDNVRRHIFSPNGGYCLFIKNCLVG